MANASAGSDSLISLPKGGGALHGIGEKFSPDLHTGTGNFIVPIALSPGRAGFQPQLNLVYSTGHGNGCFGQGWTLDISGVSRRTAKGVPRFDDSDVFIISGAEDLVRVGPIGERTRYRPRTEGLFAVIERVFAPADGADYWEVRSKEGLISIYGTPGKRGIDDPAAIGKDSTRKLAWKLSETRDPFGSRIVYRYGSDEGSDGPHRWNQPLLSTIEYAEFDNPRFLVSVSFDYEDHPEPFSDYRGGFEIRTTKRCSAITIRTHFDADLRVRQYKFTYRDDAMNGAALLSQLEVIGFRDDDSAASELPPLTFDYTVFDPRNAARRDLIPIVGADLPGRSLADRDYELIDLTGDGLPDVLEMNGVARCWRNVGGGRFDLPRVMRQAPPLRLADPGVKLLDADGDGRADLMVTAHPVAGYYALSFEGEWEAQPRRRYQHRPSFSLDDPEVRLLDLDGDGVTDALRSGARFECFFNDPTRGWHRTEIRERRALDDFPDVSFSDPRVRFADMTGSGLQDIVLIHDGLVEYWPNLGNGHWGARTTMRASPCFADPAYSTGYAPRRILLGDVDGDGLADLIYVGDSFICLWINRAGNGWSAELAIDGTPRVSDMSAVRLADLLGTGVAGVLWTADATGPGRDHYYFLDLTGGIKPYLLDTMNNHMGAVTKVEYASSTRYYLEDQHNLATRWRTHLPFPVQVVSRVEVSDAISRGKLTTEYRYHHGYWDGREREFRGFGMVEQRDSETFDDYHRAVPLHGDDRFSRFDETPEGKRQFSPPTLTRTWFHLGACEDEATGLELDLSYQYFRGDPALLDHKARIDAFLADLASLQARRDALRALRGSVLRSEVYARDDDIDRQDRPYTVNESAYGLRLEAEESPPTGGSEPQLVFLPFVAAQRTTQWERGDDPMTRFTFIGDYDAFGQPRRQTSIAMPRRAAKRSAITGAAIGRIDPDETRSLATHTRTQYADPPAGVLVQDRVAQIKTYELGQPPPGPDDPADDARRALRKQWAQAQRLDNVFAGLQPADVKLIGHKINHYDGSGFEGAEVGTVGRFGVLTRTEVLAFTDQVLRDGYASSVGDPRQPAYLRGTAALPGNAPAVSAAALGYRWRDADARLGYEAGYYADTLRRRFDSQDGRTSAARGLITATQDRLRHQTDIAYDAFDFLPIKVTDPARLELHAAHDYRHLQPISITDANGNRAQMRYSPLGLPLKQFVQSRDDGQGCRGGNESEPEIAFSYDFTSFETRGEPICVRMRRRVHHASEGISDDTIETREYSDGFGRLVQARRHAEDAIFGDLTFGNGVVPLSQGDPGDRSPVAGNPSPSGTEPNVVVSGWQVYDNKGRVVEKFEPYFDRGWDYKPPAPAQLGQRTQLSYDPRGQVIRTVNPDGSEQRVIFGVPGTIAAPRLDSLDSFEPTPWENYAYDGNDLASATSLAARAPVAHHFTPGSARVDALGRVICQVARNGPDPAGDWLVVRSAYDVRGNLLQLSDALGRQAFVHAYDLLDRPLRVDSIDAGLRTVVLDAAGTLVETRDSRGSLVLRTYDPLNRLKQVWARDDRQGVFTLRERIDYGDENDRAVAIATNSLGKPSRHADEAGMLEFLGYDFKGNLTDKKRRITSDAALAGGWIADWSDPAAERALDATEYVTSTRYDALNRAIETHYPADVNGHRARLVPLYNRSGALERVTLDGAVYVDRIAYNARGQRTLLACGNGVMTRYGYDPTSFRLARLRTEGYAPTGLIYRPVGEVRQDFAYGYDLAGNMLTIDERVKSCGVRNSTNGADRLVRRFDYDPVYRLTSATGRACAGIGAPRGLDDDPRCGFLSAGSATASQDNAPDLTEAYTETYQYDPAGNLAKLNYAAASGSWGRLLTIQPLSNRLASLTNGSTTHAFGHDANGNLIAQNTERNHSWNHADRMVSFGIQPATGPASVQARYLYGADGMRVKKWVRKGGAPGNGETTVYIDGLFEHCRWSEGGQPKQNNRLYVMDDRSRIASARMGGKRDADAGPTIQYHLADHLGGSSIVVGGDTVDASLFINGEEYFPYGETSFGAFGKKRYRFGGKENDEESGLYYFAERYFAPWTGRWTSCDAVGARGGLNAFAAFGSNPLNFVDPAGTQVEATPAEIEAQQSLIDTGEVSGVDHVAKSTRSDTEAAASGGGKWRSILFKLILLATDLLGFSGKINPDIVNAPGLEDTTQSPDAEAAAGLQEGLGPAEPVRGLLPPPSPPPPPPEPTSPGPKLLPGPALPAAPPPPAQLPPRSQPAPPLLSAPVPPAQLPGRNPPRQLPPAPLETGPMRLWLSVGLGIAGGVLSIYLGRKMKDQDGDAPVGNAMMGVGATEATGGVLTGAGALLKNPAAMTVGGAMTEAAGGAGALVQNVYLTKENMTRTEELAATAAMPQQAQDIRFWGFIANMPLPAF